MARKLKGKRVRKAKGLRHSKRAKAATPKPVGKKNKKANVKRREKRVPLQPVNSPDIAEASMLGGPQGAVTDFETGVTDPVDAD